jgi:hypothetical protein
MTAVDVTALILVVFAAAVIYALARSRIDSNVPLLFYLGLACFTRMAGRDVHPNIFGAGVVLALILRFEFMNGPFTRMAAMLECVAVAVMSWDLLSGIPALPFYR